VKETVLDAARLGFETVVLGELVRAVDLQPGDGERALEAMRVLLARASSSRRSGRAAGRLDRGDVAP
jgi:nicotinamidase-related amidase